MEDTSRLVLRALMELADDIKDEIRKRMKAYGLEGSNLYNSMDVKVMDSSTIAIELASYYINVIRGRNKVVAKWIPNRPRSNNNSQLFNALLEWVKAKKISLNGQDENRSAWIAYRSVLEHGIKARPFLYGKDEDIDSLMPFLDTFFDKWAEEVFEIILTNVNNWFKQ